MSPKLAIALAVGLVLVVAGVIVAMVRPDPPVRRVVNPAWAATAPTGPVRFCAGEDVSGSQQRSEKDYNRRFPGSQATFAARSFVADEAREVLLKSVEEGSDDCDVIYLDVVYMKEFVAKDLLYDMTPYLAPRKGEFDDRMIESARAEGRLWGVPKQMDVGVLYYRDDRARAPSSWRDVYRQAKRRSPADPPGLRLPVGDYEGLTVAFLELAYAAGARPIVTADGMTAQIVQPQVLAALRFLRDARRDEVIPTSKPRRRRGIWACTRSVTPRFCVIGRLSHSAFATTSTRAGTGRRSWHDATPPTTLGSSRCLRGNRVVRASAFSAGRTS